jgi:ADP-heptose:LPS heptosyltransferase
MPLRAMLEMIDADVLAVSLQKDVPEADREALRSASRILDISGGLTDFAETAAVISQLDLVISVCTSVAHLAGALSKPVWILLSATADWRWLIDRQDSPWYPSARLFRQETPGDWSGVVSQVRGALRELAGPR